MRIRALSVWLCGLALAVGCQPNAPVAALRANGDFGRFEGEVVAVWDVDGRNMTLREDFAYIDSEGRRWLAPAGSVVNGASIPRAFWTIIGGPFEGRYRNASVVHDVGCDEMREPWEDVHRAFYEACRCGGVEETQAKMMYYAVYHFGPRWQPVTETHVELRPAPDGQMVPTEVTVQRVVRNDPPPPTLEEVEQVTEFIAEENPDPTLIRKMNRDSLHRRPRRERSDRPQPSAGDSLAHRPPRASIQAPPRPAEDRQPRQPGPGTERMGRGGNGRGNGEGNDRRARFTTPDAIAQPQPLSTDEQRWVIEVARQYLEQRAGQALPAEYVVERTEDGYSVFVQFISYDEQGAAFSVPGGHCFVRLSREGQVLEVISGA